MLPSRRPNLSFLSLLTSRETKSVLAYVGPVVEHIVVYSLVDWRGEGFIGKVAVAQHLEIFVEVSVLEEIRVFVVACYKLVWG